MRYSEINFKNAAAVMLTNILNITDVESYYDDHIICAMATVEDVTGEKHRLDFMYIGDDGYGAMRFFDSPTAREYVKSYVLPNVIELNVESLIEGDDDDENAVKIVKLAGLGDIDFSVIEFD